MPAELLAEAFGAIAEAAPLASVALDVAVSVGGRGPSRCELALAFVVLDVAAGRSPVFFLSSMEMTANVTATPAIVASTAVSSAVPIGRLPGA